MSKYFVDPSIEFTPNQLYEYVNDFKNGDEYRRLVNLEKYYKANNTTIMNRRKSLNDDINNKLVSGYPRYVTTMTTGYFVGGAESVKYIFPNKNELIENNFRYNDERAVTTNLAKNASIYGYAIEQYFIDEDGIFRFKDIDPKNVILLFEDNIDENLLAVIKFRDYTYSKANGDTEIKTVIEFYNKESYYEHTFIDGMYKPQYTIEAYNVFMDVPFTYYENPDRLGDFESILTLVDAYDKALSDNSNLFEYYNDCYIVFKGCELDTDDVKLKDMKGLNIPEGADVFYLQKPQVTGDLMNYLETLRKDIHKFSMVPDLTDKDFLNAASGTAMRLKLQGLEFLTGVKESNFRKGLTRRLEVLGDYLSLANNGFEFDKALIVFKRNTVESLSEILDSAIRLKGIISDESVLDMIPTVDSQEELRRLKKQKEENMQRFNMQSEINGQNEPEEIEE
jgi:SPP1 family phage portal protein